MKIGDKVTRVPVTLVEPSRGQGEPLHKPMAGTVVYIHPLGRFHVVEFQTPGGAIRESFAGVGGVIGRGKVWVSDGGEVSGAASKAERAAADEQEDIGGAVRAE